MLLARRLKRIKMEYRESFEVKYLPEDAGKVLYEKDNSKTQYDSPKGHAKRTLRSPQGIVMLLVAAFLLFWFLYSFISAAVEGDPVQALIEYWPHFIGLVAADAIIILSVFGLWGKFIRFAFRRNLVSRQNPNVRALEEEVEQAEANIANRNAITIYENYVEVVSSGRTKIFDRSQINRVTVEKYESVFTLEFEFFGDKTVWIDSPELPLTDLYIIKQIFGKRNVHVVKDSEPQEKVRDQIGGTQIGGMVMGIICALAGGGVLALHYTVAEDIPIFLGAFFIVGGVLVFFTTLSHVPVVRAFLIPFLFGVIFTVFPIFIGLVVVCNGQIALPWLSVQEFFCSFSGVWAAVLLLSTVGIILIIHSIKELIAYIQNK